MPKVEIDYETLDGLVVVGLKDMLGTMADVYREENDADEKKRHFEDIEALERVLRLYE
jgi:hypothetical protein